MTATNSVCEQNILLLLFLYHLIKKGYDSVHREYFNWLKNWISIWLWINWGQINLIAVVKDSIGDFFKWTVLKKFSKKLWKSPFCNKPRCNWIFETIRQYVGMTAPSPHFWMSKVGLTSKYASHITLNQKYSLRKFKFAYFNWT